LLNSKYGFDKEVVIYKDSDLIYEPTNKKQLPEYFEINTRNIKIYNQESLGSCTANSALRVLQYLNGFQGSRLFLYYVERVADGTSVFCDSGSSIRQSVEQLYKTGVCSEKNMPYIIEKYSEKPSIANYLEAYFNKIKNYYRVFQNELTIIECLGEGNPILFGFNVYESFEKNPFGWNGRKGKDDRWVGGHAVHLVGYDKINRKFKCVNSWGEDWGDKGFFYLPFDFVLNKKECSDFWIIKI
jgi:C1A family cysteine protease